MTITFDMYAGNRDVLDVVVGDGDEKLADTVKGNSSVWHGRVLDTIIGVEEHVGSEIS